MAGFMAAAIMLLSALSGNGIVRRTSTTVCSAREPPTSSETTKYTRPPSGRRPTPSTPGIIGNVPLLL